MWWMAVDAFVGIACAVVALYVARFPPPARVAKPTYGSILHAFLFAAGDAAARIWAQNDVAAWLATCVLYVGLTGLIYFWWVMALRIANQTLSQRYIRTQHVEWFVGAGQLVWLAVMFSNPWHGAFVELDPQRNIYQTLWYGYSGYQYLLLASILVLMARSARRAHHWVDRNQATMVFIGTCMPVLGNVIYVGAPEPLPFDPTQLGVAGCIAMNIFAIYRFRLHVGSTVSLGDAMDWDATPSLLTDNVGRLVHINDNGRTLLPDLERGSLVAETLAEVLVDSQTGRPFAPGAFEYDFATSRIGLQGVHHIRLAGTEQRMRMRAVPVGNQLTATGTLIQFLLDASDQPEDALVTQPEPQLEVGVTIGQIDDVDGGAVPATAWPRMVPSGAGKRPRLSERDRPSPVRHIAGGVAHEFNNMLTSVMGNAELARLRLGSGDEKVQRSLSEIINSSERGAELVAKLLLYTGQTTPTLETLNVSDVVLGVIDACRSMLEGVSLRVLVPDAVPVIRADAGQVEQAFTEILKNAVQALDSKDVAGDKRVSIETGERMIGPEDLKTMHNGANVAAGTFVYLRVSDNGAGMSDAVRSRALLPFFSKERSHSGLSLAAVDGIVRLHEGVIEIDSVEGRGTVVTLYFPPVAEAISRSK